MALTNTGCDPSPQTSQPAWMVASVCPRPQPDLELVGCGVTIIKVSMAYAHEKIPWERQSCRLDGWELDEG